MFAPQQYGFRKNSSTELAALELIDMLLNQMNNHKIPTNFYIDPSKAFDSLRHDILLEKLAHYGLTNKAIAQLKSYLSNRKQYVQLSNVRSSVRPILVGVPQGSILGPLLFNIFINDIVKSSTKFNFILYADDTTLNSTLDSFGQDAVEIQNTIVSELQNIFKWLDVNRLCLSLVNFKTPIAYTEPLFKQMNHVKLSDLYTCHLLKLYYTLYRNKLPSYFDNFFYRNTGFTATIWAMI